MIKTKYLCALVIMFTSINVQTMNFNFGSKPKGEVKEKPKRKTSIQAKKEQKRKEKPSFMSKIPLVGKYFKNKKQTLSAMSLERLKETKNRLIQAGDKETAIKFIEKMIPLCDDLNESKIILLELADLLFDVQALVASEKTYTEFTTLYPGDEKAWYALYKAILCCYNTTLDTDRDQTITARAIELSDQFLERAGQLDTVTDKIGHNIEKVRTIRKECKLKLIENELYIFNYYKDSGRFKSAHKRLDCLRDDYLEEFPELEPRLLWQEALLALKENNLQLAQNNKALIEQKFSSFIADKAQSEMKKNMFARF